MLGKTLGLFLWRANNHRPLTIQPAERGIQLAFGGFSDSLPVLSNPLALSLCLSPSRILTPNLSKFDGLQCGILLDRAHRIGGFDCGMLAGVAGEDHTALVGSCQTEELVHLLAADLTGLIDKNHTSSGEVPARQNGTDGLGTLKTIP